MTRCLLALADTPRGTQNSVAENNKPSSLNQHVLCGYKIQEWLQQVTYEVVTNLVKIRQSPPGLMHLATSRPQLPSDGCFIGWSLSSSS